MSSDIRRRDGMVFYTISSDTWNEIKLARIIPSPCPEWGSYADISDEWKSLVPTVKSEHIDLAVNGHAKPLLESGLRPPLAIIKRSALDPVCSDEKECLSYKSGVCHAHAKSRPPDCFTARDIKGSSVKILNAWLDGFVVVKAEDC
jgi:hypothetical protein